MSKRGMLFNAVCSMLRPVLPGLFLIVVTMANAETLVVVDARGAGLKAGQSLDGTKPLQLKEGERVTFITADGRTITLRGPFSGEPAPKSASKPDPNAALAALVNARDRRSSSVGVIRAGTDAVKIPEPWLIDVTRPGPRCLREGELPVWWRPDQRQAETFTIFPIDRSWRADFQWSVGQDRQVAPALSKFEGQNLFVIRSDSQEFGIAIHVVPKWLDQELMLISWMLEKGCIQQVDAMIKLARERVLGTAGSVSP